ncbi:MAG: magnesium protoporphyrin IX methyltransferase [Rubrimonas sp.]
MDSATWTARKNRLEAYFDRTAAETWARLTSDAPVSRVRRTVRAGRDAMRATLLEWMGADLTGRRVLDAGCGTGALAVEAARRGAQVVAVDIAGSLVAIAAERTPAELRDRIDWRVGEMLDPQAGRFDHVVAMDSLIHYRAQDMAQAVDRLGRLADRSVAFTFCPRTPLLTVMHAAGRLFPRADRSPAIEPVAEGRLRRLLADGPLQPARDRRIAAGFYISHAMELAR